MNEEPSKSQNSSPQLKRVVGVWGAVWMGLGSILGTGVFVSLGIAADVIGDGLLVAVSLAALVAIANGLSSAQLAAAHPVSGGTYEYGRQFIHPHVGFAAGWMFLSAKSASAATAALGFSGYTLHTLGLSEQMPYRVGLGLALVLVLTLLVSSGLKRSNAANIAIVSITLCALSAFVAFGNHSLDLSKTLEAASLSNAEARGNLARATALMFVAYTGYGRIATLGEEIKSPARNIPRAIIATLIISMLLYVSVAWVAVATVGAKKFAASTNDLAAPLEFVASQFELSMVSKLVAVGAVTAMAGVLLNLLLGLSRVLFAMARKGDMPRVLAHVSSSNQSPTRSVWAIGALIAGLVLLGDVKTTWTFSAFTVLIYYGITNWAALRLPPEVRRFPRFVSWFGLFACFGLAAFVDLKSLMIGLGLLAIGFTARLGLARSNAS